MFFGEFVNKVDSKGRVSIPGDFRSVLQENDPNFTPQTGATVALNYGLVPGKLIGFSVAALRDYGMRLRRMPRSTPNYDTLVKSFATKTRSLTIDETGRVVLPAILRQAANIGSDAAFLGTLDTFEIVTPEAHAAEMSGVAEWLSGEDTGNPLALLDSFMQDD